jgi:hypothetical protein
MPSVLVSSIPSIISTAFEIALSSKVSKSQKGILVYSNLPQSQRKFLKDFIFLL